MNNLLDGKIVLITGSTKGLGKALALELYKNGATIILNYNNDEVEANKIFREINTIDRNCMLLKGNVADINDVITMKKKIQAKYNKLDVLINNAGITEDNHVQFMKTSQWEKVMNTNLTGVFNCSKIFGKILIRENRGKIINIASIKGQLGSEGQVNYSTTKAGVIGFTKSYAKEIGCFNVSVNAVCPGYIETDLNRNNSNKKYIASKMSVLSPERNLLGLKNFIRFMVSDDFVGISGQVFNIDSRIVEV